MKLLTATMLASALVASPAMACGFGKTADVEKPLQTAMVKTDSTLSTMSTYDPAAMPVFEQDVNVDDPNLKLPIEESND